MQDAPEGAVADLPDGRTAIRQGGRWVVQGGGQSRPAAGGWQVQPMQNPAEDRARQDQTWQAEDRLLNQQLQGRRLELSEAAARRQGPEGEYDVTRARRQAMVDSERLEGARQGWQDSSSLMTQGSRAISLLDAGAPTGPFAGARIMTGRAVGGALGFLPGIPNTQQTQQLEQIRRIGDQGALGDVGQLKGPLSEKELGFIQRLQIDADTSPETNRMVAEAMQWTARRQAAYGAALERWNRELGSPSAVNAEGVPFEAWWGRYASQALPQPGTPEAEALSSWQAANPGREAAVVSPPAGVPGGSQADPVSGQQVARRGRFNPETGEIEWQ